MTKLLLNACAGTVFVLSLTGQCVADANDWPHYRHDEHRTGAQQARSALSDPARVASLAVRWQWPPTSAGEGSFYASPIVIGGRVFIGSTNGRFYSLDAKTGALLWQYPPPPQPALNGSCGPVGNVQSFGAYGVLSSASQHGNLVIFGAPDPDPSVDDGRGSARLYALDQMSGALVWKSAVLARVNGCTHGSTQEQHERLGYSSPLVHGHKIFVGVHDAADSPVQNGKLLAVDADTGAIIPKFVFLATSNRGGGIWNSPAADGDGVMFTTGNTADGVVSEPVPNRGLSMLRVDDESAAIKWQVQPIPFALDNDPDWAAGVSILSGTCGKLAVSVMKDGWSYAIDVNNGACKWQFPATLPASAQCRFPATGAHVHGDTHYKRPAATWKNVVAITAGGEALVSSAGVSAGYGRLHGLNACASPSQRVRWIADVPHNNRRGYSLGSPAVTHGVFYIGTDQGHIVALADPAVAPPAYARCSHVLTSVAACTAAGYSLVWAPAVLADVALPDGSSAAGLRNEPAIADGRLFAATTGGHVYMLAP
jgi:outer membrane protein assembly factor BamB